MDLGAMRLGFSRKWREKNGEKKNRGENHRQKSSQVYIPHSEGLKGGHLKGGHLRMGFRTEIRTRPGPPVPKGPRRTKNTTRSKFTTRSIFSTAG